LKLNGHLLTPSDIGDVNRSRVIQAFCDHGPLTRADLARMAGVTRATIGNIVSGLIDDGLITEGPARKPNGQVGKPGRPLWFGPRAGLAGAVTIAPGSVEAALVNARGDLLERADRSLATSADGKEIVKAVASALREACGSSQKSLLGIGIAVPGVCDTDSGEVLGSGPVPGLVGAPLVATVERGFRSRVLVDNDSRALALGEKWFGAGRGRSSFASVQTGHGIGVGLVLGGAVVRGATGTAGEAGHTTVVLDGERCRCGRRGCWETIASLGWLRKQGARRKIRGASTLDARSLAARAESGDDPAAQLMHSYADNIAVGLANLTQMLSPPFYIVHGDAVGGGEVFRALIEERTRARVMSHMRPTVHVAFSELDQRAALLGAAGLVLSETFHLTAT
jgi:predicted NBD/HSP70 family sugar kinase